MKFIGTKFFLFLFWVEVFPLTHRQLPPELPPTKYLFVLDISNQKNYLYYKDTLIDSFSVSTGSKTRYKGNREMKEGVWRLGQRMDSNLAPIYGARLIYLEKYVPTKKKFVKTNLAFHGTNEPHNIGRPTSMGCVYHYDSDIIDLYTFIPQHTLVITVKNVQFYN
jgi:lipoprotein-anchoring transpeptidase ErfK/SrfK